MKHFFLVPTTSLCMLANVISENSLPLKKENIVFIFGGCGTYSTLYKKDPYLPAFGISRLMQILWYLGGLPRARFSNNNKDLQQAPNFYTMYTQQTKWKGHYN